MAGEHWGICAHPALPGLFRSCLYVALRGLYGVPGADQVNPVLKGQILAFNQDKRTVRARAIGE